MKKIGIISGSNQLNIWNGLGRLTTSLARSLAQSCSFDTTLFVPSDTGVQYSTQYGQCIIVHVALPEGQKTITLDNIDDWNAAISRTIKDMHFDILVITSCLSWPSVKNKEAKVITFVPFIYSSSQWLTIKESSVRAKEIEKECFASSYRLVAHTASLAESVMLSAQKEVYILPNMLLDIDIADSLHRSVVPHLVSYIGRLNKAKAVEPVVRCLARVPNMVLAISTPEMKSSYAEKLIDLAKKLGVESRLHMLGWLNTVAAKDLYRRSSLTIVSGITEPYGYGALDPMSLGTPVLVSGFSGLSEYLADPTATYSDIEDLKNKIIEKSVATPEQRILGIRHVKQMYTSKGCLPVLEEILR